MNVAGSDDAAWHRNERHPSAGSRIAEDSDDVRVNRTLQALELAGDDSFLVWLGHAILLEGAEMLARHVDAPFWAPPRNGGAALGA
jgi:hypothetical protein